MSTEQQRPLIIKKKKAVQDAGHHGGAWKVAYADFVTAMMAFFLLMWLLNATSEEQRKGLADYFDPAIPISRNSAGGAGMLDGETMFSTERAAGSLDEGVRPKPTRREAGATLGDRDASPEAKVTDAENGTKETLPESPGTSSNDASKTIARNSGNAELENAANELRDVIDTAEGKLPVEQIRVHMTPEGLVIELIEIAGQPLFTTGSAKASPLLEALLGVVVPVLKQTRNRITIVGHTDAHPYAPTASYTNWELSADRANTARRLLISFGFDPDRVTGIIGRAATVPIADDALAPQNRRIAITLLRDPAR